MSILVVDDEPQVRDLVQRILESGGYVVATAPSGRTVRRLVRDRQVRLVILDLNLGEEDGLDVLRDLRGDSQVPVIILTASGAPLERAIGLESGADDYIAKPFEPRELLARVGSVLRRTDGAAGREGGIHRFEGWELDIAGRRLTDPEGRDVELTSTQFDLLSALVRHPNRVLGRERLLELARDRRALPNNRGIDVHIGHLRRKIEADPQHPDLIKTVHGAGYIFTPSVERE